MGIQITGYDELYSNYKYASIPKVSEETIIEQQKQEEQAKRLPIEPIVIQEPTRIENASLEDVSLTLKVEDFNFVGKDSEIETLDMQKAVSDMQKDSVLQEYNYFVGSANSTSLIDSSDDGMVIQKF